MAWCLMYLYDSEMPDKKPRRYLFSRLEDIPQECNKEAESTAKIVARRVWKGLLSDAYRHSKITNPELVWREDLEIEEEKTEETESMAEALLISHKQIEFEKKRKVLVHEPDETAEQ